MILIVIRRSIKHNIDRIDTSKLEGLEIGTYLFESSIGAEKATTEVINYIYDSCVCMNLHFKVIVQFFKFFIKYA